MHPANGGSPAEWSLFVSRHYLCFGPYKEYESTNGPEVNFSLAECLPLQQVILSGCGGVHARNNSNRTRHAGPPHRRSNRGHNLQPNQSTPTLSPSLSLPHSLTLISIGSIYFRVVKWTRPDQRGNY